jgi:SAM-dependent methyltransferase
MTYTEAFYPESRVGGFTDVDGTVIFYTRVNALLRPDSVVLDVGCGRGAYKDDPVPIRRDLRILRGKCQRVVGIDVDVGASANPYLDEFQLVTGHRWPVPDQAVDLCLCDFVVEHVDDPDAFFAECARVTRRGGYVCIRTANARSYVGIASRLIPNRHHAGVLSRAQSRRRAEDVFPTRYRCNTARRLRDILRNHGFSAVVYTYEAEPSYLRFSRLLYRLGVFHQRYAPSMLRVSLFAFGRRGMVWQ